MCLAKMMTWLIITNLCVMGCSMANDDGSAFFPKNIEGLKFPSDRQGRMKEEVRQRDIVRRMAQEDLRDRIAPANLNKRDELLEELPRLEYKIKQCINPSCGKSKDSLEDLLEKKKRMKREIERLSMFEVYLYPLEKTGWCL